MNAKRKLVGTTFRCHLAIACAVALIQGDASAYTTSPPTAQAPSSQDQEAKIPNDELDSLVAPIALYPDPLLAQVLAASTYPLELVQLQQWLEKHKDLKDKALADAVQKEDWDPSVQSMAALPDVVKQLVDNIKWTTDLGNAFLSQESDVMAAVQRMRAKAKDQGNLKSTEQVKVETQKVENKQVIVIEQANPQVVYVPSYNPTVVYGAPAYPYPPIAYPPPGYYAAGMAISFGVGVAMGAMWSGGWGYGCGWGGNNNVTINNNNNFNRNSNIQGGNRTNISGGNRGQGGWQHNPQHRGGTPYANKGTADRFGGTTRGSSQAARQNSARQNVGRQQAAGRDFGSTGRGGAGAGPGGGRGGAGGAGGADRIGDRSVSQGGASRGGGAGGFGGSGRASSGSGARQSSSRGASSMGGGGRGGGGRGGGGGRRR
jgi:hypothetical protein